MDVFEAFKQIVVDYYNERAEKTDNARITLDDVYIVSSSYILGNRKFLLSTTVVDGMYYEITYNIQKAELYLDAYKKWENVKFQNIRF